MRRTLRAIFSTLAAGVAMLLVTSCGGGGSAAPAGARKDSTSTRRSRKADTLATKAGKATKAGLSKATGAKGKRGSLKKLSPEERAAERKRLRDEKKRVRQELRRKRREERMALRAGRTLRGRQRSSSSRRGGDPYSLKATVAGTYALVGSRRLQVGDVIAGKRVVEIGSGSIVLEQFGSKMSVRIGEPVERNLGTKRSRRNN